MTSVRRVACALLVISVTFSSLGLPFAIGGAVHVAWGPDRLRRAWVAAIPIGFYALWWIGWGHEASNYTSLHNLVTLPSYVLDGFASSSLKMSSSSWAANKRPLRSISLRYFT